MTNFSINSLLLRFRWKILFTFALVTLEALTGILFPLLIGIAIDGLLEDSIDGVLYLSIAGVAALIVGSARRFYDTRIYSGIYCRITPEMIQNETNKDASVSRISARTGLLTEFVEFLENSMPEMINALISVVGILAIIATLNIDVFFACLSILGLIVFIYTITGKFNYKLNTKYNNQLEKQVDVLTARDSIAIKSFYQELMRWNVKLSDLETINYFVIWVGVIAVFIYTPITVIGAGILSYGLVFSIIMYVFNYAGSIVSFPLFIQQVIRLKEISARLAKP
ncbi:ABC transporter six-transmembrane domain-containing protein [Alphaproteobacteria bacterium US3C007]|jgi:ABC-type multidrug transport system fused ATPase/permease subunit|nr:ABC transporter six-transmembrane domain-containing protein [Alphaproteobacteria bacterium US3C007]